MGFIRRAIIFIAQLVALVFIFISTVGGYAAGMQSAAYGVPVDPAMVEIAHNTRKI